MTAVLLARPRRLPGPCWRSWSRPCSWWSSRPPEDPRTPTCHPATRPTARTSPRVGCSVRTSVPSASFHETPPATGEAAATGLLLLGLALGLGGPIARRVLVRVPGPTGTALRLLLLRVARGGVLLALVASVAPLALDLAGSAEVRWTASGSYDVRWAVREAGLVLLLGVLSARRATAGRTPSRVAFLAGRAWPLSAPRRSVMRGRGTSRSGWPSRPCILSPR